MKWILKYVAACLAGGVAVSVVVTREKANAETQVTGTNDLTEIVSASIAGDWDPYTPEQRAKWKADAERRGPQTIHLEVASNGTNLVVLVWDYGARRGLFSKATKLPIHRFILPIERGESQ